MTEIWKDIAGYEGLYQVSNLGRVKSCQKVVKHPKGGEKTLKEKFRVLAKDLYGYEVVDLYKEGKGKMYKVHRLVAQMFLDNYYNKPQVNHINGIKTDNCVSNLEWSTNSENMKHAHSTGLKKTTIVNEKSVLMFDKITGEFVSEFTSLTKASKHIGCKEADVCSVLKGRQNSTKGYYFKYV